MFQTSSGESNWGRDKDVEVRGKLFVHWLNVWRDKQGPTPKLTQLGTYEAIKEEKNVRYERGKNKDTDKKVNIYG